MLLSRTATDAGTTALLSRTATDAGTPVLLSRTATDAGAPVSRLLFIRRLVEHTHAHTLLWGLLAADSAGDMYEEGGGEWRRVV
jgi:hypothetical protein